MPGPKVFVWIIVAVAGIGKSAAQPQADKGSAADVQRGRYIAQVGGCNDCHTHGYPEAGGKVDEKLWLTGSSLGFRGPWGTTYPTNLRLTVQTMTEQQWMTHAREVRRPPMPWFNLRDMNDRDVRALYRFLRHAGPAGTPAPDYVPPDREPTGPFISFPGTPK
ncbi:MAG: cytochrome C [Betaproteobacteria bacterium]|nr:cytochrome C [Betaproteobacteria bacterium]